MSNKQIQNQLLPKNTNAALQEVMNTLRSLHNIYELENQALIAADINGFLALQDDKLQVATLYQSHMAQVMARKAEIKNADQTLRKQIKASHAELSELGDRNLHAIERMKRCTEMLGDTLRNAGLRSMKSQRGYNYGQNGTFSGSKSRAISTGLSETA